MGRAKVTLKHIQNERARKVAFNQRRKGLMKKVSDFSILCEAKACLIVYDADGNGEPVTFPEDPAIVHSIIEKYETKKNNKNDKPPPKIFDVEDFFDNRNGMVEAEITKIQKEILNIKYPTNDPSLNSMTMQQKLFMIAKLDAKIEACNVRINMLKNKSQTSHPTQLNLVQQNISQDQQVNLDSTNQAADEPVARDKLGELVGWTG